MGNAVSSTPSSLASISGERTRTRAGVSILSTAPPKGTTGTKIIIKGVGFLSNKSVCVRFNEAIDSKAACRDSMTILATVPRLAFPGAVRLSISFDEGQTWNTNGGVFVYERDTAGDSLNAKSVVLPTAAQTTEGQPAQIGDDSPAPEPPKPVPQPVDPQFQVLCDKLAAINADVVNDADRDVKLETLGDGDKFEQQFYGGVTGTINSDIGTVIGHMLPKSDASMHEALYKLLLQQSNPAEIEIKLIFSDLHLNPCHAQTLSKLFGPFSTWIADVKNMDVSTVYIALQVGPYILNWDSTGLVVPRAAVYADSLLLIDSPVIKTVMKESEGNGIIKKICGACAKWNKDYAYDPQQRNSQHFVEELLTFIPEWRAPPDTSALGAVFDLMRKGPQQNWAFVDTVTNEQTIFKTHKELDAFCQERKNRYEHAEEPPETGLGTRPEFTLLKMIDRALWVRHLCDPDNADYAITCEAGCYFEDPRTPESLPIHKIK